jgi:hypothetical protein
VVQVCGDMDIVMFPLAVTLSLGLRIVLMLVTVCSNWNVEHKVTIIEYVLPRSDNPANLLTGMRSPASSHAETKMMSCVKSLYRIFKLFRRYTRTWRSAGNRFAGARCRDCGRAIQPGSNGV